MATVWPRIVAASSCGRPLSIASPPAMAAEYIGTALIEAEDLARGEGLDFLANRAAQLRQKLL